ncbi:MAG: hypothetical protein WAN50_00365 [Minisyncoccia bacterium]
MAQADKLAIVRPSAYFTSTNTLNTLSSTPYNTANLAGQVCVLRASLLKPTYWQQDRRVYIVGGAGCDPTQIGGEVDGISLFDGEAEKWDRGSFAGLANNTTIPTGITIPTAITV